MYQNLHHGRSFEHLVWEGFLLSVGFEKAYNTITFEHTQVMFHFMRLPMGMFSLMTQLLQALYGEHNLAYQEYLGVYG